MNSKSMFKIKWMTVRRHLRNKYSHISDRNLTYRNQNPNAFLDYLSKELKISRKQIDNDVRQATRSFSASI